MKVGFVEGDVLELSIVGYQFPDAERARERFSWHMVQGRASTTAATWDFCWQALTCKESGRLAAWLRDVAHGRGARRMDFLEPNLALEVVAQRDGVVQLRVELDLEFRAPEAQADDGSGDPAVLNISTSPEQLASAAADLESDLLLYPDGLAGGE